MDPLKATCFQPQVQIPAANYRHRLGLTNFINAHYQIRDCLRFKPMKVLIIGVGTGIEKAILSQLGITVTTLDIDPELHPDVVGSAHDLSMFSKGEFDVVIASHVLEHLPFSLFERCLQQIATVGKHAIIYLPIACLTPEIAFGVRPLFLTKLRLVLTFFWKTYRFNGEHYWEIGTKGYPVRRIIDMMKRYFQIVEHYHNPEWHYSYNFIASQSVFGTGKAAPLSPGHEAKREAGMGG